MSKSFFDGIPRVPVNKPASRFIKEGGEKQSLPKTSRKGWNSKPPTRTHGKDDPFINKVFGKITVVGLSACGKNTPDGIIYPYIVKCKCGRFEERSVDNLSEESPINMCCLCEDSQ